VIAFLLAAVSNEPNPQQTEEIKKPAKRSGKKIVFLGLGFLLLLGSGGGIGWHFLGHKPAAAKQPPSPPLKILHLDNFVVNLTDTNREAYLRVGIDLAVDRLPANKVEGDSKDSMATPEIRDAILSTLTTCSSGQLLTASGKRQLKQDLQDALKEKVPGLGVREIYFTDFLVQR
jgi:flagellar basal body-associated protein FliL